MDDPEQNEADQPALKTVQRLLRLTLCLTAVWLLFVASDKVLERAANFTAVAFTVGTFYVVTFEPRLLSWIVRRVQYFLKQTQPSAKADKKSGFFDFANREGTKDESKIKPKTSTHHEKIIAAQETIENPTIASAKTEVLSETTPRLPFGTTSPTKILLAIVGFFLIPAAILNHIRGYEMQPFKEALVDQGTTKTVDVEIPFTVAMRSHAPTHFVEVNFGDRCYTIAARCTGNGERFVELGPPVNETLNVSNRDFCLIRPGQKLNLPDNWPSGCATTRKD